MLTRSMMCFGQKVGHSLPQSIDAAVLPWLLLPMLVCFPLSAQDVLRNDLPSLVTVEEVRALEVSSSSLLQGPQQAECCAQPQEQLQGEIQEDLGRLDSSQQQVAKQLWLISLHSAVLSNQANSQGLHVDWKLQELTAVHASSAWWCVSFTCPGEATRVVQLMWLQAELDKGAGVDALRRFNQALRAVPVHNWGEQYSKFADIPFMAVLVASLQVSTCHQPGKAVGAHRTAVGVWHE
jgi:hypothetical protein